MTDRPTKRWERFSERHSTDESPNILWATDYDPPKPMWELASTWSWTNWIFGIHADRDYGDGYNYQDRVSVTFGFGPWGLTLTRSWGDTHESRRVRERLSQPGP